MSVLAYMLKRSFLFGLMLFSSLGSLSVQASEPKWEHWFANNQLEGFNVVSGYATFTVKDGILTGTTAEGSGNTFLLSRSVKDFELQFEVKVDNALNSGVQVRSKVYQEGDPIPEGAKGKPPVGRLYGPQCEISIDGHAGKFYDEARRGVWWSDLIPSESDANSKTAFKKEEWNQYRILVQGDRYQSWINGVKTADFKQPHDPEGGIGFQVHSIKSGTGPYSVHWKNVKFREL